MTMKTPVIATQRATQWVFPQWPAPTSVRAVTTTRRGGVSRAPYDTFNLAAYTRDDAAHIAANRRILAETLSLTTEPAWLNQEHSDRVVDLAGSGREPTADAAVSFTVGPVCAVLTADCLPVLFCDANGSRVGIAHAGWRGLAAGILEATIEALACAPSELLVWLGPAIGPERFAVGADVRDAFIEQDISNLEAFVPQREGGWRADLYTLARLRLQSLGVARIFGGGFCTYRDRAHFYSYRRDGVTGRMASLIWLA